jgi:C4-dicarboxylate transporter, DctM subunit
VIAAAYLLLPLIALLIGAPIFAALLVGAVAGVHLVTTVSPTILQTAMLGALDSVALLAVPFFIVAGEIMARGGIARRLIAFVLSLFGGLRSSLPLATIGSASIFGAMSGSSVACVATIGRLTLPAFERSPYGRRFGVSLVTVTGVIDVIIPPSIPMIIYGVTAQVSIPHLFVAGILPGLVVAALLACYVLARAWWLGVPADPPADRAVILMRLREAVWALAAPFVILGGVYGGVFTPTEAGGIACVYAIAVSVLIYREMTWMEVWRALADSALLIAQIMIIVATAGVYAWFITTSGVPQALVAAIGAWSLQPWMLLLIINVVLLFVGSALEPPAAILILTPLLLPLVTASGIDPLHFGLIVTVNLAIGMFLPPFGLNLFASHALFSVPLPELYRGVLPFLFINLIALALVTFVPALTLTPLSLLR